MCSFGARVCPHAAHLHDHYCVAKGLERECVHLGLGCVHLPVLIHEVDKVIREHGGRV